ncbi:MAG: hypothetical protein WBW04_07000 [Nitrolancea sp.]
MRNSLLITFVASLLLVSCSGPSGSPSSGARDVTGTIQVPGNFKNGYVTANRQADCLVAESWTDIRRGQQVQLLDETGALIAVADLTFGSPATLGESVPFTCNFVYSFTGVPEAKFYKVRIGLHDAPAMSAADLRAAGWKYTPLVLP